MACAVESSPEARGRDTTRERANEGKAKRSCAAACQGHVRPKRVPIVDVHGHHRMMRTADVWDVPHPDVPLRRGGPDIRTSGSIRKWIATRSKCAANYLMTSRAGLYTCVSMSTRENRETRSDITPDSGGHRPQRPCAQGRTFAKQEQAQGAAPGQIQNGTAGGGTTSGRTAKQEGGGLPTCGRRQPGARRRRHTQQECRGKSQTVHLHAPRGLASQCSSRVEEVRDRTSRGSYSRGTIGRKRCKQHRRCMFSARTRPEEVIPEKGAASEPLRPEIQGHSNSRCSMWRHL